jgi:hypothetical protein
MPSSRLWDRYIFKTFPLPHTLLLLILFSVTIRIGVSYHFHYGSRPILTLCVVSSLLGSISDTLAQTVELIRLRRKALQKNKDLLGVDGAIELREKSPSPALGWGEASPRLSTSSASWNAADRRVDFDFPRMIRFMGYGFFFAPIAVVPFTRWK